MHFFTKSFGFQNTKCTQGTLTALLQGTVASKMLLACFFLFIASLQVSDTTAYPSSGAIKLCGKKEVMAYMDTICKNVELNLKITPERKQLYQTRIALTAEKKRHHPFAYQEHKCCRDGCPLAGYKWMCKYAKEFNACMESNKSRRRNKSWCKNKTEKENPLKQ